MRRGQVIDAFGDGRLVAERTGRPVGAAFWRVDRVSGPGKPLTAEITALAVAPAERGTGVGRALLAAAEEALRDLGVVSAWLVTTNDNLAAFALYQKAGYRLSALRAGAIDELRRTVKPSIGEIGEHGIPIRDELELTKEL